MNYKDIQRKYEDAGCINYKLRDKKDLVNIIGLKVEDAKYYNDLSQEYKDMTVGFLLKYLNGCGLQCREGYRITKVYLCQTQELLTPEGEDGCRTIVGGIDLNVTNPDNITIERLNIPDNYHKIKESLIWETDCCNNSNTYLRVELVDKNNRPEWFHVYKKDNEIEFY